mmetsp:Transcript_26015/g.72572  ORF Transcript_26015/g.72572 Transcript_26015/m.72572 type:complete len:230 (-) Transcript_26015:536-1225(-)
MICSRTSPKTASSSRLGIDEAMLSSKSKLLKNSSISFRTPVFPLWSSLYDSLDAANDGMAGAVVVVLDVVTSIGCHSVLLVGTFRAWKVRLPNVQTMSSSSSRLLAEGEETAGACDMTGRAIAGGGGMNAAGFVCMTSYGMNMFVVLGGETVAGGGALLAAGLELRGLSAIGGGGDVFTADTPSALTHGMFQKLGSCAGLDRARTPVPLTLTRWMAWAMKTLPRRKSSW